MDGKAFRQAVRKDDLGEDDLERVYKTPLIGRDVNLGISNFCREIESRFEPPHKSTTVKDGADGFKVIYIVSEFEKQAEDFGEDADVVIKETLHSLVQFSTGLVFLPALDSNGPAIQYGARCNVSDDASYVYALSPKGTMLPFQGHARILLELGIDIDSADAWGETSLMYACSMLKESTIKWLLEKGADPRKTTNGSKATALHRVVEAQGPDSVKASLVKLLVQYKADVNAQNAWNVTPLHIAALLRLPETCKVLLTCGASKLIQDWRGTLAFQLGAEKASDSEAKRKDAAQIKALLQV